MAELENEKFEEKRVEEVLYNLSKVVKKLGITAYIVGGLPRDIILRGKLSHDIDVVVFDDNIHIFEGVLLKELGNPPFMKAKNQKLTRIFIDNITIDITPPKGKTLEEDLKERDFTINTLVIPLKSLINFRSEILDPLGVGKQDIISRNLRTPSNPKKTILSDPARIIRIARFISDDFVASEELVRAAKEKIGSINQVPKERQGEELRKLFLSLKPSLGLIFLRDIGFFHYSFPKIVPALYKDQKSPYHFEGVFEHCVRVVDLTPPDIVLRCAAFFHDIGKAFSERVLTDGRVVYWGHEKFSAEISNDFLSTFKFPENERRKIVSVVQNHMIYYSSDWSDSAVRRLIKRIGDDMDLVLKFVEYDIKALKDPNPKLKSLEELRTRIFNEVRKLGKAQIKCPLDGYEIQKIFGLPKGKIIGEIKKAVEEAIIEGKIKPEKSSAIEFIKKYIQEKNIIVEQKVDVEK
jgi:poly(A) polymerase/tRNA nucleotidyltransferase (CCA-adding enzyme)